MQNLPTLAERKPRYLYVLHHCEDQKLKARFVKSTLFFNTNMVRVSKYELRQLMHKHLEWDNKREAVFMKTHLNMIEFLIAEDKDILVDDLALTDKQVKFYQNLATAEDYEFKVLFVNEKARQENNYVLMQFEGTLADCGGGESNYRFLNDDMCEVIDYHIKAGDRIIIISQSLESIRDEIEKWLLVHSIQYDELCLVPNENSLRFLLDKLDKDKCVCVYDWLNSRIDLYRELGIAVQDSQEPIKI